MEENKKETPVEWLFQQLWDTPKDKFTWYNILNKALEKEKEEITNAFIWGETNEYQKEPKIAKSLQPKRFKRNSYKTYTRIKNKSFRRFLNANFEVGKEILKKRYGWEF
jgi:hypothetical protein